MGLSSVLPATLASVPHCQQLSSWDCGLACVSMVLSALGQKHSLMDLRKECPLESVWTIDLAYILRRFSVEDFTYYTSYIGVNWQYSSKEFYRDTWTLDRRRVQSLFAAAHDNRVRVVGLTLALDDIRRFLLSTVYAVIMLVDLRLLRCRKCKSKSKWSWCRDSGESVVVGGNKMEESIPFRPGEGRSGVAARSSPSSPPSTSRSLFLTTFSCFAWCGQKSYAMLGASDDFIGHYIVLIGYDSDHDFFYYRDPGTESDLCMIEGDDLESARMNSGTDHDLVVVRVR
ncbi:uncharacterized protein SPPG_08105 [Spizellomyces punctatus DAOM BR117]|uniref:Guanylyl cyclase n=1 Tax=Spizellomyces punctatus (strain DAOM BR117) TaxID=645134 RepID=A0A0L0H6H5_SPIPD|nr:uncharacterized protein SPPG_08105 [Spizellomyces punctatus DAOM BR117]KNC96516.1 hypothetical protein SPPG_08105 [Spizellomyces punctatus DAOM BR117]|eukprot:XP_016604556.1 hypothetical protein SPPG_08105 [Spizellomyces punctatus DAOM BR117]